MKLAQSTSPPNAPASRVRLVSLETARTFLDCDTERVMAGIDKGEMVAFDLSLRPNSKRRTLRIWRGSIVVRPKSLGDRDPETIIADALLTTPVHLATERMIGSTDLEIAWNCTDDHLRHLAPELGGQQKPRVWRFSRLHCVAFLRERLVR